VWCGGKSKAKKSCYLCTRTAEAPNTLCCSWLLWLWPLSRSPLCKEQCRLCNCDVWLAGVAFFPLFFRELLREESWLKLEISGRGRRPQKDAPKGKSEEKSKKVFRVEQKCFRGRRPARGLAPKAVGIVDLLRRMRTGTAFRFLAAGLGLFAAKRRTRQNTKIR
jgi:hypothetical protein